MNKLFTKVATLCVGLAMAAGVGVALGSTEVSVAKAEANESVDFSQQGYENTQVITEYEGTNFKITFEKGTGTNDPKYYDTGAAIRCYGGNKLTIESKDDDPLNEVSFTFASGEGSNVISSDVPTYGNNKWSGTSEKVVFTIGGTSGHRRIKTVSVKTGSGGEVIVTHSVIFNANGEGVSSMPETLTDKYGEVSLSGLSIPAREGYSFMGWSLSASGEIVKSVEVGGNDVTVYAQWEAVPEVTGLHDVLTGTLIGVDNYTDWKDVAGSSSSAVYGGNSTKNAEDAIQIRANSDHKDSGIFTTTSGGKIAAVQVKWNSNTIEDRKLEVYAKNTAYTVATELFDDEAKGTKVGTLSRIGSTTLLIEDEYEYVGIRSNSGAIYLDELVFIWNSDTPVPPVEVKYEVSFYEGSTPSSSAEYVEGAKVTIPQPTESLIPEGKEFDYWSHKETGDHYAPGDEFTVGKSSARFDAVYKDVEPVVTDWDPALKTQFENELDGFVPPFVAAFSEAIEVYDGQNGAYGFVAENVVSDITSAFVNAKYGEPTEDEGAYSYSIPTANGTVQIEYAYSEGQSVGTYFYLLYVESMTGEWSPEQQTQMTENVGLVLPYLGDDFAAALTLNDTDPEDVYFEGEVEGNKISSIFNAFASAQWDYFWMNPSTYNYFFTNPTGTGTAVFQCGAYQASATEIKTFFYYYFSFYRGIIELHESIDAYVGDSISDLELTLALVNTEMMGDYIDAADCEFSVTSFDTAGEVEVDVYYNYFYGSFTVNVIEVEATGLSLDTSKVKSSYEIGDSFDPTGLEIKLNFNNGSSQDLSLDDVEISGFDSEVAGEKTITVKYGDFTQTFKVTVNEHVPVLESIQVTKNPDKVEYEVGEQFDPSGIEVKAVYDVGDPVVVDLKDVSFSGFDSATVGEKTVTVSYGNFSTTIKVTVKKAAYTAEQFAEDFLAEIEKVCKGYDGKKNNKTALNNVWTKMSARYNELSSDEKTKIANATPKADGDAIQRMLTFYNYACKKYGLTKFISTQKSSLVINSTETTNNNLPIIVIVASAIAAVTAIGVVIGLKRRKNLLVK